MSAPTVLRALFTSFLTLALAAGPTLAFGKRHGGGGSSHGGGGSHHGGSHGGGGFHGSNKGGGGFHLGGGKKDIPAEEVLHTWLAAPRQMGGGSHSWLGVRPIVRTPGTLEADPLARMADGT